MIEPTLKSHMRKNRIRLANLLAAPLAAAVLGCSGKPGSVTTPDVDPEDAAELAEAQRDMRQLARDIAAADAAPAALRRRLARTRSKIDPTPDT